MLKEGLKIFIRKGAHIWENHKYLDANMVWTQYDLSHESFLIILFCCLVRYISLQIFLAEKEKNKLDFLDKKDFNFYGSGLNTKLPFPMKIVDSKSRDSHLIQTNVKGGLTIMSSRITKLSKFMSLTI